MSYSKLCGDAIDLRELMPNRAENPDIVPFALAK